MSGYTITAVVDSGAAWTVISPRVVEKFNIPFRIKDRPIRVVLADDNPMEYGKGVIRLETQPIPFITAGLGLGDKAAISIVELGEEDMLIGYDWLTKYNPAIDWQSMTIRGREPARKVANVRRTLSPTFQSLP